MGKNNLIKRGFTLIEVVIVLAIAALIMVVVFLAVTGAQRAQRDQARKDYANAGLAKIQEFAGNNSGSSATMSAADFLAYMAGRTVNGVVPAAPAIGAALANAVCAGGQGVNTFAITVGANPAVSTCLETNRQYRAQ